jgi:hypothetical protein
LQLATAYTDGRLDEGKTSSSYQLVNDSLIHNLSSHAAEEVKELLYREDQPNVQKEIKWTKSLSQYYAKSLMAAQYEQWDTKSEFRALAKLWGKESAWNHTAANPKSSAYGYRSC